LHIVAALVAYSSAQRRESIIADKTLNLYQAAVKERLRRPRHPQANQKHLQPRAPSLCRCADKTLGSRFWKRANLFTPAVKSAPEGVDILNPFPALSHTQCTRVCGAAGVCVYLAWIISALTAFF